MRALAALALVAAAGLALADEPPGPAPVLHEYVPPPGGGRVVGAPPDDEKPGTGPAEGPGEDPSNPTAIRQGAKLLVEPPLLPTQLPGELVHGDSPFAVDRETESRPDYGTHADSTLHYAEVFNPSVVPFKRMSALDAVREDYTLYSAERHTVEIPVGGQAAAERDLFWGSLIIALRPGEDEPIPSVAPDMRILSYEAAPPTRLVFAKDGADNFYVRTDDPKAGGQIRLVFLADAPASYFAPSVPSGHTVASLAALRRARPLPPRAQAAAAVMLARLQVAGGTPLDAAIGRLVEYFRGFQAGAPPTPSGDIYLDLASSRRGVCRHRAFAFVVTANAAGIPARYVSNEAHAFAEVWVPERGWLRIDLGGAAQELDVANTSDKAMYQPRGKDPFPKPAAYTENYTRLRGDVQGLTADQIDDALRTADPGQPGAPGAGELGGPAPGQQLPRPQPAAGRHRVVLAVDAADSSGFRGETVQVSGHARSDGAPPEGLRIDVYMAPVGSHGESARLVGQTVTDRAGGFTLQVTLPADIGLGTQEVYASTPGDKTFAASLSD